MIILFTGIQSN